MKPRKTLILRITKKGLILPKPELKELNCPKEFLKKWKLLKKK